MKHTKKLLAAVMALSMVSAVAPMSAFAVDDTVIKQDSTTQSGAMTATYDVTAKYTVTIPAGVELKSAASVSKGITASDVVLESGQKITVKLTGASNTESGASFSAKTTKGDSTATYTIGKGEATTGISVGDTVAEFTENGTQALTFSKVSGATHAGTHTETLTFSLAVVKSGSTVMIGEESYTYTPGQKWSDLAEAEGWYGMALGEVTFICNHEYALFCGQDPVAPDDLIDGSKTYEWFAMGD